VFLRGTLASRWQEPQVSGDVLRGVPNGALSLVAGLTGALPGNLPLDRRGSVCYSGY
jgi:hypothetical protein